MIILGNLDNLRKHFLASQVANPNLTLKWQETDD